VFVVGFTGTQEGMTVLQYKRVNSKLHELAGENFALAVHGDCIGADAQFGRLAGQHGYIVRVRPGSDHNGHTPKRAHGLYDEAYPPEPYLTRNKKIVDDCDLLLACPKSSEEELRSGTWATVRYAQQMKKPVQIIYPF